MSDKKLSLEDLEVSSFVTKVSIKNATYVAGEAVADDGDWECSWVPTNCGGAEICGSHATLPGWNCGDADGG